MRNDRQERARTWSASRFRTSNCPGSVLIHGRPVAWDRGTVTRDGTGPGRSRSGKRSRRRCARRASSRSGNLTMEELAQILGEELELPECRTAAEKRTSLVRTRKVLQASAVPVRNLCVTSNALTKKPSNGRSRRALTIYQIPASFRFRKTSAICPGNQATSGKQRAHHLHDGCLRIDG